MKETWTRTKAHLESVLPAHTYNTWIKPLSYRSASESNIHIEVPNSFYKDRIQSTYASLIIAKLRQLSENGLINITFVLPEAHGTQQVFESISKQKSDGLRDKVEQRNKDSVNQKYTFDNFIVGAHNQFAHAAAMAICETPGLLYNPLLIYGGVGLGKTHLLCAIGNEILRLNPRKRVVYKTSEDFVNHLIQSIRTQRMDDFRSTYRQGLDVLLIDDIQFFSGKERTQEEFFHTFNALHQSNVQIVITSDRTPKEIPELDERLRSRFEWGLFCDVSAPDLETRMAILRRKAENAQIELTDEVVEFLASQSKSNIRTLEGLFISMVAKASLQRRDITLDFAKELFVKTEKEAPSMEKIQKHVADFFHLSIQDMRSAKRQKIVSFPRQMAMYLCRKIVHASYPEIGLKFGGKDHTTVMHGVEKIEKLVQEDVKLRHTLEAIEKNLSL